MVSAKTKDGWIRTSKQQLCPVCQSPDWCTISPDGSLCCCMRTESGWGVKNGGWIHKLTDMPSVPPPHRARPAELPATAEPVIDWGKMLTNFRAGTDLDAVRRHAADLGVSAESLLRLGITWAAAHRAWAFPMFDERARVVGIRLRSEDGSKWAVRGSHQGLFWPTGQIPTNKPVLICEGPTDTAAMLDLHFFAIGRPSCSGCVEMLTNVLHDCDVVVVGDRDTPKKRPDGTTWLPGREGAENLADALVVAKARSVLIIYPPARFKDARDWRKGGATHSLVETMVAQKMPWRVKDGR